MIHDVAHGLAAAVQGGGEPLARLDAGLALYAQVVGHLLQAVEADAQLVPLQRYGIDDVLVTAEHNCLMADGLRPDENSRPTSNMTGIVGNNGGTHFQRLGSDQSVGIKSGGACGGQPMLPGFRP